MLRVTIAGAGLQVLCWLFYLSKIAFLSCSSRLVTGWTNSRERSIIILLPFVSCRVLACWKLFKTKVSCHKPSVEETWKNLAGCDGRQRSQGPPWPSDLSSSQQLGRYHISTFENSPRPKACGAPRWQKLTSMRTAFWLRPRLRTASRSSSPVSRRLGSKVPVRRKELPRLFVVPADCCNQSASFPWLWSDWPTRECAWQGALKLVPTDTGGIFPLYLSLQSRLRGATRVQPMGQMLINYNYWPAIKLN
jgi:hypothetical protein